MLRWIRNAVFCEEQHSALNTPLAPRSVVELGHLRLNVGNLGQYFHLSQPFDDVNARSAKGC